MKTSNVTQNTLTLSWTISSSPDVASYAVYNGSTYLGTVTVNSFNVTNLTNSTAYTFTVKALDTSGNAATGTSVTATTLSIADTTAPNNVTSLQATNITSTSTTLTWVGSTSSDISSYDIYKDGVFIGNSIMNSFDIIALVPSTQYVFNVKAKDGSGNVSTGTSVTVTTSVAIATNMKIENMALYYSYPSSVNGSAGNVTTATSEFAKFDIIVFADGIEHAAHSDHVKTTQIMQNLKTQGKKVFGYIPIGMDGSVGSNLDMATLKTYTDEWFAMGAYGIFLDEYGFDYNVTRARQNEILDYIHSKGMYAIMNAWVPSDACGDLDETGANNPAHITLNDYYFMEDWIFDLNIVQAMSKWKSKVEQSMVYKNKVGIIAFGTVDDPYTLGVNDPRFKLFSTMAAMYGVKAMQFTETHHSSTSSQVGYFPSLTNYGTAYTDNVVMSYDGTKLYRHTDKGTLVGTFDGTTYDGYFTTANEQPPTPPAATLATSGLIGYWNAKQGLSGTTWNNIAPATVGSYNGTLNNTTILASGGGAQFAGDSTSYVNIPYATALTNMTFEFWVTPDVTAGLAHGLFGVDSNNRFIIDTNTKLNFKENSSVYSYGNTVIPFGQLNHIVLRINGATVDFFVNGAKETVNTTAGAMTWGTSFSFGRTSSGGYTLKGILHLARLYNRALTDSEISTNRLLSTAVGL